ncbi:MAG: CaiB/BaiF CoA-transferase family protein [Cellvibrionaceae bacterium]
MNALLDGIRVLDFSEYIAGPFCGFLLADFGARVIKIEPPDGAEERRIGGANRYRGNTRMSLAYNRGKESLSVNLKTESGRTLMHKLVGQADVVIQNYVPGAAEKLGIDYDTLATINPTIIFVSSTAFGESGPYRSRKGFDIIAHAASGIMSNYADEDGEPRGPGGLPYIDMSTGMFNALGIVAALYHRSQTGKGQKIETSLFSTGLALQSMGMVQVDDLDQNIHAEEKRILNNAHREGKSHTQIIDEFAELRLREDQPDTARPIEVPDCKHRPTDRHVYPYYRVYETGNGYLSIAALNVSQRNKLCAVLDIADEHAAVDMGKISDQAYYAQKAMMKKIEARLKTESNAHWQEKLEQAGVPCGQVNYRADLYDDPQAQALGMIWSLDNADLGHYKTTGNPIRFSATPIEPGIGAPTLGQHTAKLLAELGYSPEQIADLRDQGVINGK